MTGASVLTISSQVAAGPVGNSAIVPALLSLGVTPVALPTIVLSNHPGHGAPKGLTIPATTLQAMLERLLDLGFLAQCRTVLTGYFADAAQIEVVSDFIDTLRKQHHGCYLLCDPVIGDDDDLYVKQEIAEAIRDRLVPPADGLIPNIFELGWLAGSTASTIAETAHLARHWSDKDIVVTSIPSPEGVSTAFFCDGSQLVVTRPRLDNVPHGTGDLLSGLIAGHLAKGSTLRDCLEPSLLQVERAITASEGSAVLNLAEGLAR